MTTPLVPQFVFDFTLLSNIMKIKMSREKRKKKEKKRKEKKRSTCLCFFWPFVDLISAFVVLFDDLCPFKAYN
jgi:heme/copper-type cytochrome/quinol oxidase subunit 3